MSEDHAHTSITGYLMVFAALIVGAFLTVFVAQFDFGILNIGVTLAIAVCKASLVLLYFMHLKDNAKIVSVVAVSGFLFLVVLLMFLLADVLSRGWDVPAKAWNAVIGM